jgi:hypothetical protein
MEKVKRIDAASGKANDTVEEAGLRLSAEDVHFAIVHKAGVQFAFRGSLNQRGEYLSAERTPVHIVHDDIAKDGASVLPAVEQNPAADDRHRAPHAPWSERGAD